VRRRLSLRQGSRRRWQRLARRRSVRGSEPDTPAERKRIEAHGGFVSEASDTYGPARVWRGAYGLGPGLAMARSIGDHGVAELGVHAEPEITETSLDSNDKVLILASDGVWEFIESQEAVDIVYKHKSNATAACKALINESAARWKKEEGNYRDDITAIVVFLPVIDSLEAAETAAGAESVKTNFDAEQHEGHVEHEKCDEDVDELVRAASRKVEEEKAKPPTERATADDEKPTFARRRLSVASVGGGGLLEEGK